MKRYFFLLLAGGTLAATPRLATAQQGGYPVQTSAQTQFVYQNGAVVRRDGDQTTALTQNVRLANGTKINYKSGIVELDGGKITTLREGDFVRPDGGIVFATPGSAAAARGDNSVAATAAYVPYTMPAPATPSEAQAQEQALTLRTQLMARKIELLNRKVAILSKSQRKAPDTHQIDLDLIALDAQLQEGK